MLIKTSFACTLLSLFLTIFIVFAFLGKTIEFFSQVSPANFFLGLEWNPYDYNKFGFLPLLVGTLMITFIALLFATPIAALSAIYLAEYSKFSGVLRYIIELFAGIPTIVYGYFAVISIAPLLHKSAAYFGWKIAYESSLVAGMAMGIMVLPLVISLFYSALKAIPEELKLGSMALGATKAETIRNIVIPTAMPGIISAILLAFSRVLGETIIAVMAAGLAAHITLNPLMSNSTITVQIIRLLLGDQSFDSVQTLVAYVLGLMLFIVILTLNFFALSIKTKLG